LSKPRGDGRDSNRSRAVSRRAKRNGERCDLCSVDLARLDLNNLANLFVYRYFIPPKKPPTSGLLLSPESEFLGDVCFFLNMLLFQCAWNLLTLSWGKFRASASLLGASFVLCFLALMVYFPPRMFYLAEDINRGRTWLTMLLANSPVIFRVLIGTNNQAGC
jgi:hypothetical protein